VLEGNTLDETWQGALSAPERYRVATPSDAVPESLPTSWADWRRSLFERYLT
jgi:hypothetical protein